MNYNADYIKSKFRSRRRYFLTDLGVELVKPYVSRRADDPRGFNQAIRTGIEKLLGKRVSNEKGHGKEKNNEGNISY